MLEGRAADWSTPQPCAHLPLVPTPHPGRATGHNTHKPPTNNENYDAEGLIQLRTVCFHFQYNTEQLDVTNLLYFRIIRVHLRQEIRSKLIL